ncbi:MAG: rod shape-determining protein [Halanaerobium sp.]|nr:rod shape-determining protein [Halanaerobium sp.]
MSEKIFALDIGTRTVVGLLVEKGQNRLKIVDSICREHKRRAMLDGQIHNVDQVTEVVKMIKEEMEERQNIRLYKVVVAAAGRALKTVEQRYIQEFRSNTLLSADQIQAMEFAAVQEAQKELATGNTKPADYHFVGYSVTDYLLDGMELNDLRGQRGTKVEINLLATFLPRIVVDSLLTVINQAGLKAVHLTLEPIAAADLIIPKSLKRLNLVLIDIGAGTSDIAFSRSGKITAYGMVPRAGDEITESICEYLLLDFPAGEEVKRQLLQNNTLEVNNILGQKSTYQTEKILSQIEADIDDLASSIAEQIFHFADPGELHGIICIGGGSLTPLLREKLASRLGISPEKVGVRSSHDLPDIEGEINGLQPPQAITPLGIALSYLNSPRANFLDVIVNGEPAHLFSLGEPKVSDALLAAGIDLKRIHGRTGLALTVEVNDRLKIIKGTPGTPGQILLAGEPVDLEDPITGGDRLEVRFGQDGTDASGLVREVISEREFTVYINEHPVQVTPLVRMDGKIVNGDTELRDNCKIATEVPRTVGELIAQKLGIKQEMLNWKTIHCTLNGQPVNLRKGSYELLVNGTPAGPFREINPGDRLTIQPSNNKDVRVEALINENLDLSCYIQFNGKMLDLPVRRWDVQLNGRKAKLTDTVSDGSNVEARPLPLMVNEVLEEADYHPPSKVKGRLVIEKNGEQVSFSAPINSGDTLQVYFSQERGSGKILRFNQ